MEPGSFQWCPVTGQEATSTNREQSSLWNKLVVILVGRTCLNWGKVGFAKLYVVQVFQWDVTFSLLKHRLCCVPWSRYNPRLQKQSVLGRVCLAAFPLLLFGAALRNFSGKLLLGWYSSLLSILSCKFLCELQCCEFFNGGRKPEFCASGLFHLSLQTELVCILWKSI